MILRSLYTLVLFSLLSCIFSGTESVDSLIKKYGKNKIDSLKHQAALFLKSQMKEQQSEMLTFNSLKKGEMMGLKLDTFSTIESFLSEVKKADIEWESKPVVDINILDANFLEQEIEESVALFNRYSWNSNVPKDVFLEYMLPYKIHNEYPDRWRRLLKSKTDSVIAKWRLEYQKAPTDPKFSSSKEFYYDLIVNTASHWFGYGNDTINFTDEPSFKELMLVKKGGCKKGSFFNAYVLRSAGIPATVDVVPFWGSKNGSHVTDVYWDNVERRMIPGPGRQLVNPAKVFRLTFKNHYSWSKTIGPYVDEKNFLLPNLQNDHWIDVTKEHTATSDISIHVPPRKSGPSMGYICVYNYGLWQPVYWGRISNNNIVFKNMGRNILYRIALPNKEGLNFIDSVFLLDSLGRIKYFSADYKNKQKMEFYKLNTGSEMWVKKNAIYTLYLLGRQNEWVEISENTCNKDSVIAFKNIPAGGLYRLVENDGPHRLERIFSYQEGKQIWY